MGISERELAEEEELVCRRQEGCSFNFNREDFPGRPNSDTISGKVERVRDWWKGPLDLRGWEVLPLCMLKSCGSNI